MTIKALFFDMDGTLLTSEAKIASSTRNALKICREAGIQVFLATGRPPSLRIMLHLTDPQRELFASGGVFYNGGCIIVNGIKEYNPLPNRALESAVDTVLNFPGVNMAIQMVDEKQSYRYELSENEYRGMGVEQDSILHFKYPWEYEAVKIVVFSDHDLDEQIYRQLQNKIGAMANLYFVQNNRVIDIVDKNTSKKLAIDRVAGICGLNHDEIAVFGDDLNDIEMLSGNRYSIAMGNACQAAKEVAAYITDSNDDNGIYHALKEYLKLI